MVDCFSLEKYTLARMQTLECVPSTVVEMEIRTEPWDVSFVTSLLPLPTGRAAGLSPGMHS